MRLMTWAHLTVLAAGLAVFVCLMVLMATEDAAQSALRRTMGLDRQERAVLAHRREKLQRDLDFEAAPLRIEAMIRRLGLPLREADEPEHRVAAAGAIARRP